MTSGPMSEYEYQRRLHLPERIEAARHKVRMLETEARRYGMTDLLQDCAA